MREGMWGTSQLCMHPHISLSHQPCYFIANCLWIHLGPLSALENGLVNCNSVNILWGSSGLVLYCDAKGCTQEVEIQFAG